MRDPDQAIWDDMLAHLRNHHPTLCRQWFNAITPVGVDGGAMVLRAASDLHRDYLRRECLDAFNDAARTATESLIAIRFLGPDDPAPGAAPDHRARTPGRAHREDDGQPVPPREPVADHAPRRDRFDARKLNDEESRDGAHLDGAHREVAHDDGEHGHDRDDRPGRDGLAPGRSGATAPARPAPVRTPARGFAASERGPGTSDHLIINPDNGFENFVVGPGNRLAHAAAVAVAENPGYAYNPYFVHGDVGLGKTHLLQAICVEVRQTRPDAVLHYVSCDTFINEFMLSVRAGQMSDFRHRFRDVDVLVIDDIHFLAERDRTQEEFFHTFNSLYQLNKQIVLSSDAPPEEIPHLEARLVSRFKWGLVARVDPPGYETRIAILQAKARLRGLDMPGEVAAFVAGRIDTNIRELEGAVVQLQLAASVEKSPITLELAKGLLGGPARAQRTPTLDEIVQAVCDHFEVKRTDLLGKRRHQSISLPRQVCMALARRHTRHSFEEIGATIGGRDHTTVMHACKAVDARCATDAGIEESVRTIERQITEPRDRGD